MRCMQFDDHDKAALRALGFTITEDGEVAQITGKMWIELVRPADRDRLSLSITLPTGPTLDVMMPRDLLLDAVGVEEDEPA